MPPSPNPLSLARKHFAPPAVAAYSVIELLAVIAVLGVLAALMTPAFQGFSGSSSRRGAINLIMNTIDHARVAAIEKGRTTYILFLRRKFPLPDGITVLQEPTEPLDAQGKPAPLERLTPWIKLPSGILFPEKTGVFAQETDCELIKKFPPSAGGISLSYLSFGPTGKVEFPTDSDSKLRQIHLMQGTRSEKGSEIPSGKSQGIEVISVTRYTGRPQLDFSSDTPQ